MENEERVDLFEYYKKNGKFSSTTRFMLSSLNLPANVFGYALLHRMGMVNIFLYDKTQGFAEYYENSLLLIFNPSVSFYENNWQQFSKLVKSYPNFICENYYDYCIYGYWIRIDKNFGNELRYLLKQGKFSSFPKNYLQHLPENEQKICRKDLKYQRYLEDKLGLEEGELDDKELASIPDREEYTFQYIKNEKINNI